jgi:DNA-directed RNA polymerase omega subunit
MSHLNPFSHHNLHFDLDNCLRFIPNKYELILLAKCRALDIHVGNSQPLIQKTPNEKSFFTALKEIDSGFHNYDNLNDQFMLSIKNEVAGVLVQTEDISINEKDKFDENSLFAQIFQNIGVEDSSSADDVFDNLLESSEDILSLDDLEDGFVDSKKSLDDDEI